MKFYRKVKQAGWFKIAGKNFRNQVLKQEGISHKETWGLRNIK